MLYFKDLFNKFCLKISTSKFFKFFFGCVFLFFFIPNVKADTVKIYTSTIPTNNYLYVGSGSRQLNFETDNVYYDYTYLPRYFLITLCSTSDRIYDYSINSVNNVPTLDEVSFLNTSYSCTFPTSGGATGHLIYVVGQYSIGYNCSASMTNCTQKGSLQMNVPNNSSWTLLAYQNSIDSISIDYATNTIVTQNQSIISGQSTINSSIINMQNSINANANANAAQAHSDATSIKNSVDSIKNQDHTYNNNATDTPSNQSDINSVLSQQNTLSSSIDLDSSILDVTLNTDATTWIWGVVDNLRTINGKITLLFTTILSLAVIKMILNR